jgi:hypothetical protein
MSHAPAALSDEIRVRLTPHLHRIAFPPLRDIRLDGNAPDDPSSIFSE